MKDFNNVDWVVVGIHMSVLGLSIGLLFAISITFGLLFISPIYWVFKILSLPIIFLILGFGVTIFWDEVKRILSELKN